MQIVALISNEGYIVTGFAMKYITHKLWHVLFLLSKPDVEP